MNRICHYLRNYKKESVLGPLFKLLEALFDLFVPLVMASLIDKGIANSDKPYIAKMCILLVVLAIIGLTCSVTAQYFAAKAAAGFGSELRHDLFSHILTFQYSEVDRIGTSTLITRMTSDINQVQSCVNMSLRLLLRSPFIVVGALISAFFIDIKAALIFAVTIPVLAIIVYGIMLITMPMFKAVQSHLDQVMTRTRENLTGVRVIRAFNREGYELGEFEKENGLLYKSQQKTGFISGLTNPLTFIVINLATAWLIYAGALRIDGGLLTKGQLIAMVNYMTQILVELVKLANLIVMLTKALACFSRIEHVLDTETSMKDVKGEAPKDKNDTPFMEFSNVCLRYGDSSADSLSDISFSVKKGDIIGIIGGTGSGKSSLVNLIPRFYDITGGSIKLSGNELKAYPLNELRKKIGIVPQRSQLFSGTIRDNLRFGNPDATDEELWDAVRTAQGEEVVKGKENGLDSIVEQGGRNFSGGQKQRLTIARALVKKPEILILDDSSSALDFATDAALRHAIKDMKSAPTMFIVSQRTSSIQFADKIIVLDDGRAVGIGTHEELLDSCDIYKEIYDSQFKRPEEVLAEEARRKAKENGGVGA